MQKPQIIVGSLAIAAATIGLSSDQALGEVNCCFHFENECEPCCLAMSSYCCSNLGGEEEDSCSPADCLWSCSPTPLGSNATLSEDIEGPSVANAPPAGSADLPDGNSACSASQAGNNGKGSVARSFCCIQIEGECEPCCLAMSSYCCSNLGGSTTPSCSPADCLWSCRPAPPESGAEEPVAFSTAEVYLADVEPEDRVISSPADPLPEDPDCEEEDLTAVPTETSDAKRQ